MPAQNAPFYVEAAVQMIQGLGLTRRQAEVLHWTAEGKTNEDIGQILGCSIHTVKNHLKHIFSVLGVTSRTAAAACAYRAHMALPLEPTALSIRPLPSAARNPHSTPPPPCILL